MKLWKISQDERWGYDTYDSVVVAAETENEAKAIHPYADDGWTREHDSKTWATSVEKVKCEYLGEAKEGTATGEILSSFNAG